jgi:hypothetical protein
MNGRTCSMTGHRKALLASDVAVCCYCLADFPPGDVVEWVDGETGETALCPHCEVDAVVGFNGPVDAAWVAEAHRRGFE